MQIEYSDIFKYIAKTGYQWQLITYTIYLLCAITEKANTANYESHVSLTVEGGDSLVGEHCPGTVRLFCEGVDITHLRWSYNSTDQEIVFFELDEEIKIIHLPSTSPFIFVELSNVSQSELAIFGNFSSILTLNISQLEQQHITEIRCGDPESVAIVYVNVELRQQSPPESPQLINISFSKISLIVLWESPMDAICSPNEELFYNITLFGEENKLTKILTKSSVCSEVCNVTLPLSGPGNYQFELQAVNNKGTSDPVIQNFNISVRCEIPSRVANGEFLTSNLTEGGTLTLTCDEGFRIIGPAMANCTRDSLWQPNIENTSHCVHKSIESPTEVMIHFTNQSMEEPTQMVCEGAGSDSPNTIIGLSAGITFSMAIVVGFISGTLVTYLCMRKKAVYSPTAKGQANVGPTTPAGPVYEEVSLKEEIELNTNSAYGQVGL